MPIITAALIRFPNLCVPPLLIFNYLLIFIKNIKLKKEKIKKINIIIKLLFTDVLAKAAVTGSPPKIPAKKFYIAKHLISAYPLNLMWVIYSAILAEIKVSITATNTIGKMSS